MLIYRHPIGFHRRFDGRRTPEYLGKKIESREIKLAMLYMLIFPLLILYYAGWSAGCALRRVISEQRRTPRPQ